MAEEGDQQWGFDQKDCSQFMQLKMEKHHGKKTRNQHKEANQPSKGAKEEKGGMNHKEGTRSFLSSPLLSPSVFCTNPFTIENPPSKIFVKKI